MKLLLVIILIFQAFFLKAANAQQTWTLDRVTYGVAGKGIWHYGTGDTDPVETGKKLQPVLDRLYQSKTHPLKWCEEVDVVFPAGDVELLWHMSGSYDAVQKQLTENDPDEESSFLWEDGWKTSSSLKVEVILAPGGRGILRIFDGEKLIGRCRCVSASDQKVQPAAGEYKILSKASSSQKDGTLSTWSKEASVWMTWALKIGAERGIFIHGGSLKTTSRGCVRVTKAIDDRLHQILSKGCVVKVEHTKETEK